MSLREYKFKIDLLHPDSIPMLRMSKYIAELSQIIGSIEHTHLSGLEEGSTVIVHQIDEDEIPNVIDRIHSIKTMDSDISVRKPFENLNKLLKDDKTSGNLINERGDDLLYFPGAGEESKITFLPFYEQGTIEGMVFKVGGRGETVSIGIMLDRNKTVYVGADRSTATELGHVLYKEIRVYGGGRWYRDERGKWELARFKIDKFETLETQKLTDVVEKLRGIEGSEWNIMDNPWDELKKLREGE